MRALCLRPLSVHPSPWHGMAVVITPPHWNDQALGPYGGNSVGRLISCSLSRSYADSRLHGHQLTSKCLNFAAMPSIAELYDRRSWAVPAGEHMKYHPADSWRISKQRKITIITITVIYRNYGYCYHSGKFDVLILNTS